VRLFFQGKKEELIRSMETEMSSLSKSLRFEEAAAIRDRLYDLRKTLERQVVAGVGEEDLDVWALRQKDGFSGGAVLALRSGSLTGCQPIFADGEILEEEKDMGKLLSVLMGQFYGPDNPPPKEIILPVLPPREERELLNDFLKGLTGGAVKLSLSKKGARKKLMEMAGENAKLILEERLLRLTKTKGSMTEIQNKLRLPKIPRRIECFDLAHIQGDSATAGMVVMEEGEFKKSAYRRFKIKMAKGGDDYAGMREVIKRRFSHDSKDEKWTFPDLLLLDGGRGQIASAIKAFNDLSQIPPPMAGITKDRLHGGPDRIFLPGRKNPADLKPGSAGMLVLQKLRDEAHRFSRGYHHLLRSEKMRESLFSGIKGLGPLRQKALAKAYDSLEEILAASDQELQKLVPIGPEGIKELRSRAEESLGTRDLGLGTEKGDKTKPSSEKSKKETPAKEEDGGEDSGEDSGKDTGEDYEEEYEEEEYDGEEYDEEGDFA
jgi:excinuclease ABC subunit C